ncbi:592_t:CDS:2, partial [Cetraspora pellucida]
MPAIVVERDMLNATVTIPFVETVSPLMENVVIVTQAANEIEHVLTKYLEGADAQQQNIVHKVSDQTAEDPETD